MIVFGIHHHRSEKMAERDFISGEMKYFHVGVWSFSYNCLHDTTRNGTHCVYYFIAVTLTEMKFYFG